MFIRVGAWVARGPRARVARRRAGFHTTRTSLSATLFGIVHSATTHQVHVSTLVLIQYKIHTTRIIYMESLIQVLAYNICNYMA